MLLDLEGTTFALQHKGNGHVQGLILLGERSIIGVLDISASELLI